MRCQQLLCSRTPRSKNYSDGENLIVKKVAMIKMVKLLMAITMCLMELKCVIKLINKNNYATSFFHDFKRKLRWERLFRFKRI